MKLSVMSGDMQIEEDVIYRGTYKHTCTHTYIFYWLVPTGFFSVNVTIIIKNTHRRLKTRKLSTN